jgi:methylmalonyl-CoA mutase
MTELSLAADFPQASLEDWARRATAALKGQALEKLTRQTRDGIAIAPLHAPSGAPGIAARPAGSAWKLVQRIDITDPAAANAQALEDLNGGATGLALHLPRLDAATLGLVLKDVQLHAIHLRFGGGADPVEGMLRLIEARAINPARLDVDFGLTDTASAKRLRAADFVGPLLNADGRAFHDAGATEAQELGFTLSRAIGFLRAMDGDAGAVSFTLSASPDMFLTLAKFRAMRLLWARVLEASGMAQAPVAIHAETSFRHLTLTDAHVNMLRAVAGVFGAGLGGADSICVLPHTLASGSADGFVRRMARNVQVILMEESNLHRVADPAAGSGYVESLTEALAEKAWSLMQEAERGADVSASIDKARDAQMARVAKRADPITGTSEFPNLNETIGEAAGGERLSSAFEKLRRNAQKVKPAVRLVTLGRVADFTARSLWTQNLLAAGGIGISEPAADVAVICGSDETYAAEAAGAADVLRASGVKHIWIAGKHALEGAGQLHAGMDVVETLQALHRQLGVQS